MAGSEGPAKIKPKDLANYFEVLTRAVFQSRIRWSVIEAKWPGFLEAFVGFLGDMGAYYFLWVVSEPVPSYEQWSASRGRTPKYARRGGTSRSSPRSARQVT